MKIAKPKKPFDPNKKKKPPRDIIKYLRIKKKTYRKLRKRALTQKTREKLLKTIASCEKNIRTYYQRREEAQEKEAWERKKINSRFFFRFAKTKARRRAPIGPFH